MADTLAPAEQTPVAAATARRVAAIETSGLTKRYGETVAVDQLTVRVERGEIFGLLGPNGAGKTTTILMLLGLSEPTSGTARVEGLDPKRDPLAVKRIVGYLPDDVGFYDELTGRENLLYTARLNRIPRHDAEPRINAVLTDVGLSDVGDRRVRGYSRGMRQRLGLADALLKQPKILILDEPTVNIDPEGVRHILDIVRRCRDEQGVTVLLSSHLLHQVEQICDRIGIFVAGRLVAAGSLDQLTSGVSDRWVVDIIVEAAGTDGVDLGATLLAVPGVEHTDRRDGGWRVTATRDVRPELAAAVTAAGGRLLHLSRHGADLDALYHRYFPGDGDDRDHGS